MTRGEHLNWAKVRALEYLDDGDLKNAVVSMLSDLRKHPELENHAGARLGVGLMLGGMLRDRHEIRRWIVGFN